jgi:mannose-1-phosphate guanylyltransferase
MATPHRDSPRGRLHAVILAGGSGTRFWPLSRKRLPKQFLALTGEKSLLRETYERLAPMVGPERVWVVMGESHRSLVQAALPEIPEENLLAEPVGRNTAPCIGLAAQRILIRDPAAAMLVCPSDHVVQPEDAFRMSVESALAILDAEDELESPWTVTFGIVPRYPATGFGYIERGPELAAGAFRVARFKEKPVVEVAEEYLRTGRYLWNSGIFLWHATGLLTLLEKHLPELASGLHALGQEAAGPAGLEGALQARFGSLPSISIDYGVLERARNVAVVAADFGWDDVGSWRAVERYGHRDGAGNSVLGRHVGIDTRGCIIVGKHKERLIATLGVENLVIVETDDAILVCSRDDTERVKEIVDRLQKEGLASLT